MIARLFHEAQKRKRESFAVRIESGQKHGYRVECLRFAFAQTPHIGQVLSQHLTRSLELDVHRASYGTMLIIIRTSLLFKTNI